MCLQKNRSLLRFFLPIFFLFYYFIAVYNENMQQKTRDIYSVSRLNFEVKGLLNLSFPLVWLEGEISNFALPASGHMYLSLKDATAQVRCAMFKGKNRLLNFVPKNGMQVLVRAKIGLYEPRGEFQIVIEHMEESGEGALRRQFEQLKSKLNAEGLFDSQHKVALPELPNQVGVITSPTGAAIRDIVSTLNRRMPNIPVIIYPVAVQGEASVQQITKAITVATQRKECDVLIIARGGGSLEDLNAFNDERVARAIHKCSIPVVSGVGHEIDFTISDFVADYRAETPTAAAESVCPDHMEIERHLAHLNNRLCTTLSHNIQQHKLNLQLLHKRLKDPTSQIQTKAQRVDELFFRLTTIQKNKLHSIKTKLYLNKEKLNTHNPEQKIIQLKTKLSYVKNNLDKSIQNKIKDNKQQFLRLGKLLHAVSPLSTLERGYSISTDTKGKLITRVADIEVQQSIVTRIADGELTCTVNDIKANETING